MSIDEEETVLTHKLFHIPLEEALARLCRIEAEEEEHS